MSLSRPLLLMALAGCAGPETGVLYLGIDLAPTGEAAEGASGRLEAWPALGHATIEVTGLPGLADGLLYVPALGFAHEARELEAHDLEWTVAVEPIAGGAAMFMAEDIAPSDMAALRIAAILVSASAVPDLDEDPVVLSGALVLDESLLGASGGGHEHGP